MTRLLVVAIGRTTFDLTFATAQTTRAWDLLDSLDVESSGDRRVLTDLVELDGVLERYASPGPDLVVVLQATFSDSSLVGRIAELIDVPLIVWSFPEERTGGRLRLNSLCGANLAAYVLRRRSHPVQFLHLDPATSGARAVVGSMIERALTAEQPPPDESEPVASQPTPHDRRLAAMFVDETIGVIGRPPSGFEPCEGDRDQIRRTTGVLVDTVELDTLFAAADAVDADTRDATLRRIRATMDLDPDVQNAGLCESVALYGGLTALRDEHGWGALATRCWPECMTRYGGAVCTPMAMLTENGVPSVCEADVYGAVTALVLHRISGTDPFVADLVDADREDDTSVLWHCGVASTSLADPGTRPVGISHPNRHRALANQFALRAGRVTIARLSQSRGRIRLIVGGGEILRRPRPFEGTCGVVLWDAPVDDVLDVVFTEGLEHHLGIVYGDHRDALASLAAQWRIPVVHLT
jgi:L-fucose isomerase-like protein